MTAARPLAELIVDLFGEIGGQVTRGVNPPRHHTRRQGLEKFFVAAVGAIDDTHVEVVAADPHSYGGGRRLGQKGQRQAGTQAEQGGADSSVHVVVALEVGCDASDLESVESVRCIGTGTGW